MLDDWYCSPDVPTLSKTPKHFVFVYGTLKRGKANSYLLDKSTYLCPGWTALEAFHMYQTRGEIKFPVAIVKDALIKDAKSVQGELFQVDVPTLKRLDQLEDNGTMYRRFRFKIKCGDRFKGQETFAWMYVGVKNAWQKEIESGQITKCPVFNRKKEPKFSYYSFITGPLKLT